ncbi:MAG: ribosomal protection-like ABC-F family protein [Spirochaetaceae bacterium]
MRVQINGVSHDYAGTEVLTGVTAAVLPGQHIGIVGANGCGKTTLVRILCGELEPTGGSVSSDAATRIGYVPQSMDFAGARTVGEYLLADILPLRAELRRLESAMSEEPDRLDRVLAEYEAARDAYDTANGDTAEERAERLLGELGLVAALEQDLTTLSGGEQNVLALGRAVISRPDLLILDEPGNHLDFAGLAWLEEYLRRYPGAVCIVSHNRYLLDRVAETIWEIERGALSEYTGNYSDYRFTRLAQALSDQATYAVQQRKLARLTELVRVFEERARVTGDPKWGKRLRARRTMLEKSREQAMDIPTIGDSRIEVAFQRTGVKADIAVDISGYSKAFGRRVLFEDAGLTVHVGERIGIVGPNGSGKTTLLEELVATGSWDNTQLRVGPSMRIGYCAQKRERFAPGTSVTDAMLTPGHSTRNEIFGVLTRLNFVWEDLDRPVESLSGGEWNRLQLGIAIIAKANLLILDEPTNHLDIPSREAVEEALHDFDGTIIAVSHDRYFLDAIADTIVVLDDLKLQRHQGSFSEFWMRHRPRSGPASGQADLNRRRSAVRNGSPKKREPNVAHEKVQAGESKATEKKIIALEAKQNELEAQMADAFASGDYRKGRKLGSDLSEVRKRIEELYARWGG